MECSEQNSIRKGGIMTIYEIPKSSKEWIKKELSNKYSPDKAEEKYQEIIKLYEKFSNDAPSIGGKENPMSKHFYGALSAFAYYECMNRDMSPDEITDMCFGMMIGNRKGGQLSRFNLNNKLVQKIFHGLFRLRARKLNRHKKDGSWNNTWGMRVNPLKHKEGISIHLVGCPIADFAENNGYSELMPYFCETDKAVMEHLGGALYREHTVADGYEDCDYWIKNKGK